MTALYLALGLAAFSMAFVVFAWRMARANAAGIAVSRLGRVFELATLSLRLSVTSVRRRALGVLVSKSKRDARARELEERAARDALTTMGNMKGVLMKLGQIISFMDDTLPAAYRAELSKLQSNAPPMAWELVEAQLRIELGKDPHRVFKSIEETPMAAASIGQVHRAVLEDGTRVAVKVQYPGVDRAIAADLDNYAMLSAMIEAVTPAMDAGPVVGELRARFTDELDYTLEAESQERFRAIHGRDSDMLVPRVIRELSTRRVLVTELVEGAVGFEAFVTSASLEERRRAGLAIHRFAFDSLYDHYLFNGDPHPGNYLFLPGGRVVFLDFGCVKRFEPSFVEDLRELNRLYLVGKKEAYHAKMVQMRYILPGVADKVTVDWLWEYMHYYYLPLLADADLLITPEHCKQAIGAMFGPAMRKLNMPGDFVLLTRINFGLNSIQARLAVPENWRRASERYFFPEGQAA